MLVRTKNNDLVHYRLGSVDFAHAAGMEAFLKHPACCAVIEERWHGAMRAFDGTFAPLWYCLMVLLAPVVPGLAVVLMNSRMMNKYVVPVCNVPAPYTNCSLPPQTHTYTQTHTSPHPPTHR